MAKNNLKKIIILNKKEGETPLEATSFFREKHKEYKNVSMTYAGRLDPMAGGVLIVLAGEECKSKEKYLKLDKEYEFEVLFGCSTDTYDILGKITQSGSVFCARQDLEQKIKENLKYFKGKFIQKYPMYSSKTVNGKQLFVYARNGEEVEIPTREVNIKKFEFLKLRKISSKKLLENINKRIKKVNPDSDFRQEEILKTWREILEIKNNKEEFFIGKFKIKCSSGTYVRGIANSLGEKINIPALAFSIKRIKVGKFSLLR